MRFVTIDQHDAQTIERALDDAFAAIGSVGAPQASASKGTRRVITPKLSRTLVEMRADGLSFAEIGRRTGLQQETVRRHIRNMEAGE